MKTPEEIKKGLECCNTYNDCQSCPYDDKVEKGWGCCVQRNADALTHIQHLEARLVEANKTLDDLKADILRATNKAHEMQSMLFSVSRRIPPSS